MSKSVAPAKVQIIGAFIAMLLIAGVVVRASSAAFSGEVSNAGNAFETGSLALGTDVATEMFNVTGMVPGQVEERCVTVTYSGSTANPAPVVVYSGGYTHAGTLDDWLLITVEEGTGATNVACAGFTPAVGTAALPETTLKTFNTAHTDYSTGVGTWDPAATPETQQYRFTVKLNAATPDAQEGQSLTDFAVTWEVTT